MQFSAFGVRFTLRLCPKMNQRLLAVTLFHAVFACYIDIQGVVINYMSVPLGHLFNESLIYHYGIDANPAE